MHQYWRSNRNVILTAVALFVVSLSSLVFFLKMEDTHEQDGTLKANVVDSISLKSHQEAEDGYRDLLENHEDPLMVVNLEGTIQFSSWDFELVSGHKTSDLEGKQLFTMIHPDDLPAFIAQYGKTISSHETQSIVGPYRMRTGEGDYRIYMASFYPLEGDEHDIEKIAIVSRDITDDVAPGSSEQSDQSNSEKDENAAPSEESETRPEDMIRNQEGEDDTRLIVDKLAKLMQIQPTPER